MKGTGRSTKEGPQLHFKLVRHWPAPLGSRSWGVLNLCVVATGLAAAGRVAEGQHVAAPGVLVDHLALDALKAVAVRLRFE